MDTDIEPAASRLKISTSGMARPGVRGSSKRLAIKRLGGGPVLTAEAYPQLGKRKTVNVYDQAPLSKPPHERLYHSQSRPFLTSVVWGIWEGLGTHINTRYLP